MRQILYVSSSSVPGDGADLEGILHQSRHNNALDGITGLLWSDGTLFLQVIEGPRASVAPCFERIRADKRHHSLTVLMDRRVDAHEFGSWNMAHRRANDRSDAYDSQMSRLLSGASQMVRLQFTSLIATGSVLTVIGPGRNKQLIA